MKLYPRKSGRFFPLPAGTGYEKFVIRHGAQNRRGMTPADLKPYIHRVAKALRHGRWKHDKDTLDLLREFEAFLLSCAVDLPPQSNMRGLKPRDRARAILGHVYRQQSALRHLIRPPLR